MSIRRSPRFSRSLTSLGLAAALALLGGCEEGHEHDEHGHEHDHESEVITTVRLTFAPQGGADAVVASFTDPDGDGGMSGSADPIALMAGTTYDLRVEFLNELEDPAEDITAEIEEEAEEHQVLISGTAVEGPATAADPQTPVLHAYADTESRYGANAEGEDLPVGLAHTITARTVGTGTFVVMLRHLPELNGAPQKEADLAAMLAAGEALPGDVDALVEFELTVP
ncbi:hypothetical protein [Paraliomyxa miuraensis]|uniref:hypothetical protein n=1 Tax=Paraliomyxa miuraensis TaxID=376150 RepID=UPI00224E43DA|nr:hypothetical protein [Paraliomyxa miuraensis]MCX4245326.1 hypothetical protein [Paraliomyxa miuraensis]